VREAYCVRALLQSMSWPVWHSTTTTMLRMHRRSAMIDIPHVVSAQVPGSHEGGHGQLSRGLTLTSTLPTLPWQSSRCVTTARKYDPASPASSSGAASSTSAPWVSHDLDAIVC